MIHTVEIFPRVRSPRKAKGERFAQVVALMHRGGGVVRASDLVNCLGMKPALAGDYLRQMTSHGRFIRREPGELALKPGKWEPAYQLNLDFGRGGMSPDQLATNNRPQSQPVAVDTAPYSALK